MCPHGGGRNPLDSGEYRRISFLRTLIRGFAAKRPSCIVADTMVDTRTKEQRRRIMQAVRGKDTGPEWTVRRLLHSLGYRYRLHRKDLPGKPDLAFPSRKKAIFVHGCFWHAHGCRFGRPPKSRLDFWLPKLARNRQHDAGIREQLEELGWQVLTVWQCETKDSAALTIRLCAFLESDVDKPADIRTACSDMPIPGSETGISEKGNGNIVRPIGVDLFAGAGGLSLGFEYAGFDIVAAIENDPIHCATHEFNFPYCTTMCRSVLDARGADIRSMAGIGTRDIAVVFGGAPCQGFSMIGKRSLDDPRNELVHHFVRLVLELQPAYFVFENVKGLTVGSQRQVLGEMIETFDRGGYHVLLPYRVLNAADYGVPQERHRLFLLGSREDRALPCYPKPHDKRVTVAEALDDLPVADWFPDLMERDWTEARFGPPSAYARRLRDLANAPDDFGYRRMFNCSVLTSSLRTTHTEKSRRRFAATAVGKFEPVSQFYKLDPDGVCNTLRSGTTSDRGAFTSPRPIHPYMPRCITNREAARLHSYPDWFRFHVTKWHGFRQIGNSVPPLLAQAVAAQIMTALGGTPSASPRALKLGDSALLQLTPTQASKRYTTSANAILDHRLDTANSYAAEIALT